jgi:hypothetical protein
VDRSSWIEALRPDGPVGPVDVRCAPATHAAAVRELGRGPADWAVETADAGAATAAGIGPGTAEAGRILAAATQACVLAVLRGLHARTPAEALDPPAELLGSVRGAVRGGVAVSRLLRMMWTTHLRTLDRLAAALPDTEGRSLTTDSFGYVQWFSDVVERRYAEELSEWSGSVAAARMALVDRLLTGEQVAGAEATLGYALTGRHVAVLLTAEDRPEVLDGVLARFAGVLGADGTLVLPRTETTVWGWLHWSGPSPAGAVDRLRGSLPPGVRATLGPEEGGAAGFRWSHLAAREVDRLGAAGITAYADAAVAALLTADTEHAAHYALAVLGPQLGAADEKARRLRETLAVYLAEGRSRAAAAERLHIASGTVAYRVRQAEAMVRSADVHAVLAACEILRVLDPPLR